jgi:hypothetical protein
VPDKQKMSRLEAIRTGAPLVREKIDSDSPEDSAGAPIAPVEVNLPEIHPAFLHLQALFFRSGQCSQTGYGLIPLSWQEIQSFIEVNELELTLFEKQMLRKMSEAYCSEYSKAKDIRCPAPYTPERKEDEVEDEADKLAKALRIREQMKSFRKK